MYKESLRRHITHLNNYKNLKYKLYMGNGFYTDITLSSLLKTQKYASNTRFIIEIEKDIVYVILRKSWKGKYGRR